MYKAKHPLDQLTLEDYRDVQPMIETVRVSSRLSPSLLFVSELHTHRFLYVANSPVIVNNLHIDDLRSKGQSFFKDIILDEEKPVLEAVDRIITSAPEVREDYVLSFHFHIQAPKQRILINTRLTVLACDSQEKAWLLLGIMTHPAHQEAGHIIGGIFQSNIRHKYLPETQEWVDLNDMILTPSERQMLLLASRGFSIEESSELMCRSEDTIRYYRRSVFEKLQVNDIRSALQVAQCYSLL